MEGVIAVLGFFGMPVAIVWLRYHYRALEKGVIKQKQLADPQAQARIDELEREKKLLSDRVANLESIVCSVDFELNQRLNKLVIQSGPPSAFALGAGPSALPAPSASTPASSLAAPPAAAPARLAEAPPPGGTLVEGAPAPGALFGRYQVERELGRGGMGVVLLARDLQLGERVALKVVSARLGGDPEAAADRFRREASAARKVSHPNVIRIYELGESAGTGELYLAMEYFQGQTLSEILRRRGALPLDEAREYLAQICDGLAAAHRAGVIHRDLKPGNVLVGERRSVKIIDFGLAKSGFLSGLTATGLIMGTPEYMAPEQVRGKEVDARADIYALGALAFHVVTGAPPFTGDTPIAVGFAHCTQPVRAPERADLPPQTTAAIVRALAKDPRERFATVDEMRAAMLGA